MKTFLSKYFFPLAALAALIAYLLCHFQEKRCIDPITTYEVLSDGIVIEPDSTLAGVTQVKIKVSALDSAGAPGATLLDATVAPNAKLFVPVPPNVPAVRVAETYLNEDGTTAVVENGNLKTAGIIIVTDVVIRGTSDPLPLEFLTCCSTQVSMLPVPLGSSQFYSYDWNSLGAGLHLLKITLTDINGADVSFIVAYGASGAFSYPQPTILGLCTGGNTTGFTNCDGGMTTMYNSTNLNFSIHFYKINPGSDMQIKIVPESNTNLTIQECNS